MVGVRVGVEVRVEVYVGVGVRVRVAVRVGVLVITVGLLEMDTTKPPLAVVERIWIVILFVESTYDSPATHIAPASPVLPLPSTSRTWRYRE